MIIASQWKVASHFFYNPILLALLVWSPCSVEDISLILTGLSALGALWERESLVCDRVALTLWVLGDGFWFKQFKESSTSFEFCFCFLSCFFLAKNNLISLVTTYFLLWFSLLLGCFHWFGFWRGLVYQFRYSSLVWSFLVITFLEITWHESTSLDITSIANSLLVITSF